VGAGASVTDAAFAISHTGRPFDEEAVAASLDFQPAAISFHGGIAAPLALGAQGVSLGARRLAMTECPSTAMEGTHRRGMRLEAVKVRGSEKATPSVRPCARP